MVNDSPKNSKILICGAGIAGPTLAYWLQRYGFEPTLIEPAPALRKGGYIIDFWGLGFDVAEKMGFLPALKNDGYDIDEVRMVNEQGERHHRPGNLSSCSLANSEKKPIGADYVVCTSRLIFWAKRRPKTARKTVR